MAEIFLRKDFRKILKWPKVAPNIFFSCVTEKEKFYISENFSLIFLNSV